MFDHMSHRWKQLAFVIAVAAIFAAPAQAGGRNVDADQFMNDFGAQAVRLLAEGVAMAPSAYGRAPGTPTSPGPVGSAQLTTWATSSS